MPTKTRKNPKPDSSTEEDPPAVVNLGAARQARRGQAAPDEPRVLLELRLDQLVPDSTNVRSTLTGIDDLASSVATHGILEPLLVTPPAAPGGQWRILAGHRRRAAAIQAGLITVPCITHQAVGDVDRVGLQLVENLQRDDLTPTDEALAYQALVDAGETQRAIAARVGRNQSHISKRLKLLALPDKCRTMVDAGDLTVDDALALSPLAAHPERITAAIAATRPDKDGWADTDTMSEAVEDQLRILEREQLRLAAFAELDEAGVRVIDWPTSGYGDHGWPAGHRRLDQTWKWPGNKTPTKAKLAKARHLAAAVDERGNIVYLCTHATLYETTTSTGAGTGSDRADASVEAAARTRAINKRRRNDRTRRLNVAGRYVRNSAPGRDRTISDVIAGDGRLGQTTALWVTSILDTWLDLTGYVRAGAAKTALEVLDVDDKTKTWDLRRLAREPEYSGQVNLAVWVALAEERLEQQNLLDPLVTAYYRWLQVLTYEPGAEEQADLETALGTAKAKAS